MKFQSSAYRAYEDLKHSLSQLLSWMGEDAAVESVYIQFSRLHSVKELDERLTKVVELCKEALLQLTFHALAKRKSRFRKLYSILPKRTIVRLVKARTGLSSASILPTLLFSKPLGAKCLMQRIAMALLSVKELAAEVKSAKQGIPKPLLHCCEVCIAKISNDASIEEPLHPTFLHDSILNIIESGEVRLSLEDFVEMQAEDEQLLQRCSQYASSVLSLREASAVAEMCGSDDAAKMFKTLLPVLHRSMFSAVSRTEEFVNCKYGHDSALYSRCDALLQFCRCSSVLGASFCKSTSSQIFLQNRRLRRTKHL